MCNTSEQHELTCVIICFTFVFPLSSSWSVFNNRCSLSFHSSSRLFFVHTNSHQLLYTILIRIVSNFCSWFVFTSVDTSYFPYLSVVHNIRYDWWYTYVTLCLPEGMRTYHPYLTTSWCTHHSNNLCSFTTITYVPSYWIRHPPLNHRVDWYPRFLRRTYLRFCTSSYYITTIPPSSGGLSLCTISFV